MTNLPEGWEIRRLEDLCEPGKQAIVDGPFGSNLKRSDYVDNGIPVLKIQNIKENLITLKKMDYVSPDKYQELVRHSFTEGDIVMTKLGDPLGVSAIVNGIPNGLIVADLVRIRPSKVLTKFLCYQLNSPRIQKYINEQQKGTTRPRVNLAMIRELPIYTPPIEEQHKIVDFLEDHLSRLDAALVDVKQAKIKAAQFRRSFIHEMTTSIGGSQLMGILDVCHVYQPKTISTKELISDGAFPVYGANGQIGFYDKFNHDESEVTVTCRGATCGTVNVIPPMSWITGNAMVFKPKDDRIQKGFLEYVLRGMDWTPVITGTAQPQITRTSMQDVYINIPSPEMQREIYMKLESSLTQVTSAGLLSEKVEKQGASLRRSLLQAAFTGQLTNEVAIV
jgi:type I restriction enzyme S subunit